MISHKKQVNVNKILPYSKKGLVAGEDGHITIDSSILEPLTDSRGFLTSIEDADEYDNGDIVVCGTDGDFALYVCDASTTKTSYTKVSLDFKVSNDCIYNIKAKESKSGRSFICSGEIGAEYEFSILS